MILRVLFDGLWQGAAIVAIAYLVTLAVSRRNATTRYAVWFAALIALVVVPLATTLSNAGGLLLAALQPHAVSAKWTISLLPAQSFAPEVSGFWSQATPWIVAAWSVGAAIGLLRLGTSLLRIARIRKDAVALSSARGDVLVSRDVAIPVAVGVVHPAIVLPRALVDTLTPADLERVLAHERAHVRRHDVAGNLVQRSIEAILFFNPWVHVVGRALVLEREAACDDWAVAKTGTPDDYAALLASLAVRLREPKAPLATPSALGSRHALVSRIERLAGGIRRPLTLNYYVVGGTAMLFVILTLALEALSPALAFAPPQSGAAPETAGTNLVAADCATPHVNATVTSPAEPKMPQGLNAKGSAIALVTIAPNGSVMSAVISKSSGNAAIDKAVLDAARHSTYSPELVYCRPVEGQYLFRADFKPDNQ
ncbi:MAG: TonB family protein [Candidatus Cybelea sp.]